MSEEKIIIEDPEQIKADIEKRIDEFIERYAYENKKIPEQLNIQSTTLNIAHMGMIILLCDDEELIGSCVMIDLPEQEQTLVIITGYYEGTEQIH